VGIFERKENQWNVTKVEKKAEHPLGWAINEALGGKKSLEKGRGG